jgi:REP element-mobilizing transposase RayT
VCIDHHCETLGRVVDGAMVLSDAGRIVAAVLANVTVHFPGASVYASVVMPNHVHAIIVLTDDAPRRGETFGLANPSPVSDGGGHAGEARGPQRVGASPLRDGPGGTAHGSLAAIVQNVKSVSARRINALRGTPGSRVWQRNYYEHVIGDEPDLWAIEEYIANNPAQWAVDRENPEHACPR